MATPFLGPFFFFCSCLRFKEVWVSIYSASEPLFTSTGGGGSTELDFPETGKDGLVGQQCNASNRGGKGAGLGHAEATEDQGVEDFSVGETEVGEGDNCRCGGSSTDTRVTRRVIRSGLE